MRKSIFLVLSILSFVIVNAQNNLTVTSLSGTHVDTILKHHLEGEGVIITNGKFNNVTGNVTYPQIGTFNRNNFTTFPFSTGLVLTTGNVSVAAGPNNSSGATSAVSPSYTESQLSSLATSSINGSASLEFDFLASADTFAFNYIFGSEEYCEYVNSSFNDVFAFFLTGIDPVTYQTTTKNVAIIPGTITASNPNGTPVSINNVNSGNPCGSGGSNSTYYIDNNSTNGVQYDGYTTALSASATIFGCQNYHMKLAIANVGDNSLDSGVFLEEGSFYSPHVEIHQDWENDLIGGDTLIQNCRELDLTFTLPRPALTAYTSIIINTAGNAVLGQDYALIKPDGSEVTIEENEFSYQPGDTVQKVHVKMLPTVQFTPDNPTKTAILYIMTQGCTNNADLMDMFQARDTIILHLRANDSVRLRDTAFTRCERLDYIEVEQISGTPPTLYSWITPNGIVDTNQLATACNITQTGVYQVVASDHWGCLKDTAKVQVTILPKPDFTITYTPDHGCMPLPVTLQVQYSPNYATLLWNISDNADFSYVDSVATIHTSLPTPGYYNISLVVESAPGCSDSLKYNNVIHVADYPHADFTYGPDEPGNGEEVFFFNHSTGDDITDYTWNFGDGHSSHVQDPTHTYHLTESDLMTVHLTVTNSDGCADDTIVTVPVEDHFAFFVPSSFTPNNDGKNEIFLPRVNDVVDYEFTIFARTGELIFQTNSPEMGWDGTIQGKPAPEGIYVWKIHYAKIGTPEEKMMKTGTVTLIR